MNKNKNTQDFYYFSIFITISVFLVFLKEVFLLLIVRCDVF